MCDWPVYDIYHLHARDCGREGRHQAGPLSICTNHLGVLVDGVLDVAATQAAAMIADGRRTPGGIELQMIEVLADIQRMRRAARYEAEGRASCVYFVERQGYVKIGSTVNIPARMRALSSGGQMLDGMTVGPVTLLATTPGGLAEELALHKRFRRLRVDRKREWFRYEGALRELVEGLQADAA